MTGDGIVAALQVLSVMAATGRSLMDLVAGMPRYPQELINVAAPSAHALERHPRLQQALVEARTALGVEGRIVLRPSGTEPLLRVMVEGADAALVHVHASRLAAIAAECAAA